MECSVEGCTNKAVVCQQHGKVPARVLREVVGVTDQIWSERDALLAVASAATEYRASIHALHFGRMPEQVQNAHDKLTDALAALPDSLKAEIEKHGS